jgi:hypothetical protein
VVSRAVRAAEVFAAPGPPDLVRLHAISAEHGHRFERPAQVASPS